jgi:hypothetical protein
VAKMYSSFIKIMEPSDVPLPETIRTTHWAMPKKTSGKAKLDWIGLDDKFKLNITSTTLIIHMTG